MSESRMSVRRRLSLVGVGLAAVLSVFALTVLRVRSATSPAASDAPASKVPDSSPQPLPLPAIARDAVPVRTPVKEDSKPGRGLLERLFGDGASKPPQDDERKVGVDVTIIVTDSGGTEHSTESGAVRPGFYDPPKDAGFRDDHIGWCWRTGDEIAVADGRFHVDVPEGLYLGLVTATLGGRPLASDGSPVEVKADAPVTLRGHWIDGVRVHVIDATTRAELDDVTVVRPNRDWGIGLPSRMHHPGADIAPPVLEHAPSPVTIAPWSHERFGLQMQSQFWLRASDHAWKALQVDFRDLSERTVELSPAATLIVTVEGELPRRVAAAPSFEDVARRLRGQSLRSEEDEAVPQLRLRQPVEHGEFDDGVKEALDHYDEAKPSDFPGGTKPSFDEFKKMLESERAQFEVEASLGELIGEQPAAVGETRMEGLEPGPIEALVELGDYYQSPLVTARAPVKLVAGQIARVTLTSRPPAERLPVPLAGTLLLPAGWPTDRLVLRIEASELAGKTHKDDRRISLDEMVRPQGAGAPYIFNVGAVPPATYAFSIDEIGFSRTLEIGEAGNDHVALVVPEPGLLHVRIVDAVSGTPARVEDVIWSAASDDLLARFRGVRLKPDADGERNSGLVPVGPGSVFLEIPMDWQLDESPPTEIHTGEQEITLRARRGCGVAVSFTINGKKISAQHDWFFEIQIERVEPIGADLRMRSSRYSLDGVRLGVTDPGRYRVRFPEMQDYAPLDPIEVDVPAGQFVPLEVALHRR